MARRLARDGLGAASPFHCNGLATLGISRATTDFVACLLADIDQEIGNERFSARQ